MNVYTLGSFMIEAGDRLVRPTAAKPRKVLATLAMHPGDTVATALLYEELWGEQIPRTANTTVQVYISQLRKLIANALGPDGDPKRFLITCAGGYRLDLGGRTDWVEFERLAAAGHRAREVGDFVAASRFLGEALAVWRGPALCDVVAGAVLSADVHRLEEARRNALDRRIDADLRIGRHHQLVGELTGLTARHPTHEGLHMQLMIALSRCGRRSEAMHVYRRLHLRLGELSGLEPSAEVGRLLRSILSPGAARAGLTGSAA